MTPEIFAEWLRRQGYHVIRTESSYWFNQGPRVYQAFPYHWVISPSRGEIEDLLHRNRMLGVRYSAPVEHGEGAPSYHIVCDDRKYCLHSVRRSSRTTVRQGLEKCTSGRISIEQYAEEGWAIQRDTEERQGRGISRDRESWRTMALSAAGLEGFEAWGAFVEGRLAATAFLIQYDDCVNVLYQQSLHKYLHCRVNNALTFVLTQTLFARPAVRFIHYGLHSLDAPVTVDNFKLSMGYSLFPVRQRVVLHPAIPGLMIPPIHAAARMAATLLPKNNALHKAEGFLRFYEAGRYPYDDQHLPELMRTHKPQSHRSEHVHELEYEHLVHCQ